MCVCVCFVCFVWFLLLFFFALGNIQEKSLKLQYEKLTELNMFIPVSVTLGHRSFKKRRSKLYITVLIVRLRGILPSVTRNISVTVVQ